jgi:hypothetical protein
LQIKILKIKGFGPFIDQEFLFEESYGKVIRKKGKEKTGLIDGIVALLFGFPPHRREEFKKYYPLNNAEKYSASLLIETKKGEYLIGRDFSREILEVFKYEGMRLFSLPSTVLMDLLYSEIGTLNPLDFEALFLYKNNALTLNQHAPIIREHIQQLLFNNYWEKLSLNTKEEDDEERSELEKNLVQLENLIKNILFLQAEIKKLEEEEDKYHKYEEFLSTEQKDLLEELTREHTAAALERSFYEDHLKEEQEAKKIIEREARILRKKITAFDLHLYTPEILRKVIDLIKIRDEKTALLQKLETEIMVERKGIFSRFSGKEAEEKKVKIEWLLGELSGIRESLRLFLKEKKPEDYLKEVELLIQYQDDLLRLEHPFVQKAENRENQEKLEAAIEREKDLRQQLDRLLALAGQEDLETVKAKANRLKEIKQKKTKFKDEIKKLGEKLDLSSTKELIDYLQEEKKHIEEALAMIDETEEEVGDEQPLVMLYQDASNVLEILTSGYYKKIRPQIKGNKLEFVVKGKKEDLLEAQIEPEVKELIHLSFRLALAKYYLNENRPPILLENPVPFLNKEHQEKFFTLLEDWFQDEQIILIENVE